MISFKSDAFGSYLRQGYTKRQELLQSSLEKISSGLRINRASDDAAGLSIATNIQSQMRGDARGIENIISSLSMIEVADKGIESILNALQRIREIALSSSNGVYGLEDRRMLQSELNQLLEQVDRVARDTSFNGIHLLGPRKISLQNAVADIVFMLDDTGSMSPYQTALGNNLGNVMNALNARGLTNVRFGVLEFGDGSYNFADFGGSRWSSDTAEVKNFIDNAALSTPGAIENGMEAIEQSVSYYDWRHVEDTKSSHLVMLTNEDSDDGERIDEISTLLQDENIQFHSVYDPSFSDIDSGFGDPANASEYVRLLNETGGVSVDITNASWDSELSTVLVDAIVESATSSPFQESVDIQISHKENDLFAIELMETTLEALGLENLDISDKDMIAASIAQIDTAMDQLLSQRTKFGAYTSRLNQMVDHLSKSNVVTSSVISKITDADVAKEMTYLTKNQILFSSNTTMLKVSQDIKDDYLQGLFLN